MYNPCFNCLNKYGHSYTEECDTTCVYARDLAKLKPYGSIDEIIEILKGDKFPVVFLDKNRIDSTYHIVNAAKAGLI